MWKQARAQEKRLRVLIVDYRRRAERRREFYNAFKADPAQFLQVHARPCKIHMDAQITASAENCLMPWQGQEDNMVDRFDARNQLDRIPEVHPSSNSNGDAGKELPEEPSLNYERYRILIQNELAGISEDKFLHQIWVEEQFGTPTITAPGRTPTATAFHKHKDSKTPKAAIAYNYDDTPAATPISTPKSTAPVEEPEDESDEDIDFDLMVNVEDLNVAQQAELNNGGVKYGLAAGDFMKFLNQDLEEKEQMRLAKLQEEEKQTMSGRKARRERRAYKDRIILRKGYVSPPSYAVRADSSSPVESKNRQHSESKSRSNSPEKITFITSFGGNESDDEKKRGKGDDSLLIGPNLPPGGLPSTSKWRKSPSPPRRRSRSHSRSGYSKTTRISINSSSSSRRRRSSSGSSSTLRKRRKRSSSRSRDRSRHRSKDRRRSRSRSRSKDKSRRRRRSRTSSSSNSSNNNNRRRRRSSSRRRGSRKSRSRSISKSRSRRDRHRSRSKSRSRSRRKHRSSSSKRDKSKYPSTSRSRSSRRARKSSRSSSTSSSSSSSSSSHHSRPSLGKKSETLSTTLASSSSTSKHSNVTTSSGGTSVEKRTSSPPVRCYYDRAKAKAQVGDNSDKGESESESDYSGSEKRNSSHHSLPLNKMNVSTKKTSAKSGSGSMAKLTPQERIKRMINKQLKADKEAEKEKFEKKVQERIEREESIRELSIQLRRREREKRHRNQMNERSDSSRSSSSSRSSKSRSGSPCLEF